MSNHWKFSQINCIEEYTFHKVLERFYNFGVAALVKENIQNSLDARLSDEQAVEVKIEIGKIHKEQIPGLDDIKEHINSLQGKNSYTRETIEHMKHKMNEEAISLSKIVIRKV